MAPALMARRRWVATDLDGAFVIKINIAYYNLGYVRIGGTKSPVTIDWGDGTTDSFDYIGVSLEGTHTYSTTEGIYTIKIMGQASHIAFGPPNVVEVVSWGTTNLDNSGSMFAHQPQLTVLPSPIVGMENAVDFNSAFSGCTSLTTIPEDLFDNCPNVTDFRNAFSSCHSLTTISEGLFDNCPNVTDFNGAFASCLYLTTIPKGLFDNCPNVTNFSGVFTNNYYSLTTIPEGLFDNCPNVTNFNSAFSTCPHLTTIPEGLFDNCPNVTDFRYAFSRCEKITSAVPRLWETHPNANGAGCFSLCTSAANYAEIPDDWK